MAIEVPALEDIPAKPTKAEATPKPTTPKPKARAKSETGWDVDTLDMQIAMLEGQRKEQLTYFGDRGRALWPKLQAATEEGNRSDFLNECTERAYEMARLFGVISAFQTARRLAEAEQLRVEAQALRDAVDRSDAAAAALKVSDEHGRKVRRFIRDHLEGQAASLDKRARARALLVHPDAKFQLEGFDPAACGTWPKSAQRWESDIRTRFLRYVADAQERA